MTLPAVSAGPALPAFTSAKVVEVRDDGALVIEPVD